MSNDLISRKALSKNICNAECTIPKFESEKELNAFLLGLNAKQIVVMECLSSQPTAYDPDKVVEQINEARFPITDLKQDVKMNGVQQTDDAVLYNRVIEIMEGGGVE